jgi:hypothetical protein
MKKAIFYIGANNSTKELEKGKIEATLNAHFSGYSASEIVGYWQGSKERTLMVQVVTEDGDAKLSSICKELCKVLEQDAVMLEIVESNIAFISM